MLVLSRKMLQSIQIGEGIVVTVLKIKGNKVQIGIEAPADVHVMRSELQREAPGLLSGPIPASIALIDLVSAVNLDST